MKAVLITTLRHKNTSRGDFRAAANQLTRIVAEEVVSLCATTAITVETPLTKTAGVTLTQNVVLVPILRSGMAMVPAFWDIFTQAAVGCIGMKRDEETAVPHLYYKNLPPIDPAAVVIVLDPMLATGGSLCAALGVLRESGVAEERIIYAGIIAAPEGEQAVKEAFPRVQRVIAQRDERLSEKKFILPGLGDFGDRYFGTE